MITVKELDPRDPDLLDLIQRSHQTSLYVLPEWLELLPPRAILGAYEREKLTAAAFVESMRPQPFVSYRGILLSRRDQGPAVQALLEQAEKYPNACLYNAPSFVDVRPFAWRYPTALWRADVRYTVFLRGEGRHPDPGHEAPGDCPIQWLNGQTEAAYEAICGLESVSTFTRAGAVVVYGMDLQGRGYYIAGWGEGLADLIRDVASPFSSFDLGGANSPAMASRKKGFAGQLRTIYKMWL